MRFSMVIVLLAAWTCAIAGCGDDMYESRRSAAPEAVGVAIDGLSPPPVASQSPQQTAQQAASQPAYQTSDGTPIVEQGDQPRDAVQQEAEVGVGKKGDYSQGIITTPLSVYFRAQERITFNIQIPSQMKTYEALNGRKPRNLEEYMKEIIEPARIDLPELPQGHKYVYNPETGELLVEHPR